MRFLEKLNTPKAVGVTVGLVLVVDSLLFYRYQQLVNAETAPPPAATEVRQAAREEADHPNKEEKGTLEEGGESEITSTVLTLAAASPAPSPAPSPAAAPETPPHSAAEPPAAEDQSVLYTLPDAVGPTAFPANNMPPPEPDYREPSYQAEPSYDSAELELASTQQPSNKPQQWTNTTQTIEQNTVADE